MSLSYRDTRQEREKRAERGGADPNSSPPQSVASSPRPISLLMSRSTMLSAKPRKSLIDLAEDSGFFDLNASDLVFDISTTSPARYYDFVLSCRRCPASEGNGKMLYLMKFDQSVNLELFESCHVPQEVFDDGMPQSDLGLMTLAVLIWKNIIAKSRVLCLVRNMEGDNSQALEALKRATYKFSVSHHVQTLVPRRASVSSGSSFGSNHSYLTDGMKMRVLLCQSKNEVEHISAQSIREAKALLNPSSNPILCVCFPLI
uniref:Tyrosine-protein phosphatase domain-containing protein n=2 Tax=Caenorhabditis tropicalis TaxID=1561998 RepID=A0A1I7UQ01_9PELO